MGFWLADWPTDADLLNLRKHSETPEHCPILWHVFLYKPILCRCGCTAEQSGGKSSGQIFCLRSICRGEASATGLCSHLTNRWLIQANYNTSTLKLADRDRSQIPHLWNRVCLMNNAIIISTVDNTHWKSIRWRRTVDFMGVYSISHNGTNRFIIWIVNCPPSAQLMNQTFHRHSSVGLNRSGY